MAEEIPLNRDFPTDLTAREAKDGFKLIVTPGLLDDPQQEVAVVAKFIEPFVAILKLRFQGAIRYRIFAFGFSWVEQNRFPRWHGAGESSEPHYEPLVLSYEIESIDIAPHGMKAQLPPFREV